jgi:hypothetical protein
MKTRIFFVIAAVLVFGLGIATFAYKQTGSSMTAAASCCCKGEHKMTAGKTAEEGHKCCGDSCPMKAAKGEHKMAADHKAAGEGHTCCGDSCPMKAAKGEHKMGADHQMMAGEQKTGADNKAATAEHKCCGDSCPMKKKDGETKVSAASASDEGKSCCDNCECCKGKAKTTAV